MGAPSLLLGEHRCAERRHRHCPRVAVPNPFSLPSSFYFFPELSPLTRGAELRGLAMRKSRFLGGRTYGFSPPCQALRVWGNASLPGRGSPWPAPLL